MKRVALALAVLGVLGVAANRALARGAPSRPMAAHVAAKHGIHHAGHHSAVHHHHAKHHRHYRHRPHRHPGYYHRRPPVVGYPWVPRYPAVVVPYAWPYYARPYYCYGPTGGFYYSGRGVSVGIGF